MGSRWTPLTVLLAVVALLLAGAGVVAAVTHEDDDDPKVTVSGDVDQSTTTTVTALPDTTTSTTVAPATTTSAPTTTTRPSTTTTTRRTTSTTARPATSTTTGSGQPLCAAEQIDISARSVSTSYPAGAVVGLTTTIRNQSSAPCFYQGYTVTMTFLDPAERPIISSSVVVDSIGPERFAPGQTITHLSSWDPRVCPTPPCALPSPGIYAVSATWAFSGGRYSATMQYVLR